MSFSSFNCSLFSKMMHCLSNKYKAFYQLLHQWMKQSRPAVWKVRNVLFNSRLHFSSFLE